MALFYHKSNSVFVMLISSSHNNGLCFETWAKLMSLLSSCWYPILKLYIREEIRFEPCYTRCKVTGESDVISWQLCSLTHSRRRLSVCQLDRAIALIWRRKLRRLVQRCQPSEDRDFMHGLGMSGFVRKCLDRVCPLFFRASRLRFFKVL